MKYGIHATYVLCMWGDLCSWCNGDKILNEMQSILAPELLVLSPLSTSEAVYCKAVIASVSDVEKND